MTDQIAATSSKWRQPGKLLFLHFFISAMSGILIFISILLSISAVKSSWITDLSVEKRLFIALIVFMIMLFLGFAFTFLLNGRQATRLVNFLFGSRGIQNKLSRFGGLGLLLCWVGFFLPSYLLPWQNVSGFLTSIKPLFAWGIIHFVSMVMIFRLQIDRDRSEAWFKVDRLSTGIVFTMFFLLSLVSLIIIKTGYGISTQEDYWYGAGVPVLWTQLLVSILIGLMFAWLRNNFGFFGYVKNIDLIVFFMLWLLAAFLWAKEPLQSSYFMPDTGVNAIYPYSDSATFDIGSQYALVGQGLFNGQYFDRILYSTLLTYLHALFGQKTENLMVFQAALYAVFPAILYLLGRELHGRELGISLGFLAIYRGINAIFGASLIDLAGPKTMLTDFPTAIGISLLLLFVLKWLQYPQKISNIIWAGCVIGLTLLLRSHVILLLPFVLVYFGVHFKEKKILWLYGSIFLILGMMVTTLPLDFQNQKKGVPMFYMYYSRIETVLQARYGIFKNSGSGILDRPKVAGMSRGDRRDIYRDGTMAAGCESQLCSIGNHFFHNLAGSILYLPSSFVMDDFKHIVKESAPYWQKDWTGADMRFSHYLLLFVNLFIISMGLDVIWKRVGLTAFFPLMIYLVYMLSNSLALTSGGRYLAPVDWIIGIYYLMGALCIFSWLLRQVNLNVDLATEGMGEGMVSASRPIISFQNGVGTLLSVFMLGGLLPLTNVVFPERYQQKNNREILATLSQSGLLEGSGLSTKEINAFLADPNARLIWGRLLYPRFYASSNGEPGLDYPYTRLDYRRLVFTVIGPVGPWAEGVILPRENAVSGLHGRDVVVLGCRNEKFLDALVVFILSGSSEIFIRPTGLTLQCPLPNP